MSVSVCDNGPATETRSPELLKPSGCPVHNLGNVAFISPHLFLTCIWDQNPAWALLGPRECRCTTRSRQRAGGRLTLGIGDIAPGCRLPLPLALPRDLWTAPKQSWILSWASDLGLTWLHLKLMPMNCLSLFLSLPLSTGPQHPPCPPAQPCLR